MNELILNVKIEADEAIKALESLKSGLKEVIALKEKLAELERQLTEQPNTAIHVQQICVSNGNIEQITNDVTKRIIQALSKKSSQLHHGTF